MHRHSIAHLDISLRNIVTDHEGHYAYIDFEMSRQFDASCTPLVHIYRATEVPPECDRGVGVDPFKVDVWALAVLILRASKVRGRSSFHPFWLDFDALLPAHWILAPRAYVCPQTNARRGTQSTSISKFLSGNLRRNYHNIRI